MSTLSNAIAGLGVRKEEGKPVLLLLAYSFLLGSSLLLYDTASYALFLDRFDAGGLPWVYILVAMIVPAVGLIYSRLEERLARARLLQGTLAFLVITILLFRLAMALSSSRWLLFGLIIWDEILYALTGLGFWALAGFIFDVRQGKRLFGLIGAGRLIAGIASGLSVPGLVGLVGTTNLIYLSALVLAPCLLIVSSIIKEYPERLASRDEVRPADDSSTGPRLLAGRYVRLILLLPVFSFLIYYFVDFIFFEQAEGRFTDELQMARFLGLFLGLIRTVNLLVRTFLSGRLLDRYGLRFGLLSLPALLLIGGVLTIISQASGMLGLLFWLIVGLKLIHEVILDTVYSPSMVLLYQPLPGRERLAAQTLAETIAGPMATGISGALLLIYLALDSPAPTVLILIMLPLLVAWLGITIMASREYTYSLLKALQARLLSGSTLVLDDASTIAVLRQKLTSPFADEAIYALNLLERAEHPNLAGFLAELLDHPAAEVRREALARLEARRFEGALSAIGRCLEADSSPSVRGAALQALSAVGRPDLTARVIRHLHSAEPDVKLGAMVGLLRYDQGQGASSAIRILAEMARAARPEERALAARAIGLAGRADLRAHLRPLLADEAPQVQRAALQAAGQLKRPDLWPLIIALLPSPTLHKTASAALVSGGAEALPALREAITSESASPSIVRRCLQIVGRIDDPQASGLLTPWLDEPDRMLRAQALSSLRRRRFRARGQDEARVMAQIALETTDAARLLVLAEDLGRGPGLDLLNSALALAYTRTWDRIFDLLALLYERRTVQRVQDNLEHPSSRQRAYALELLDAVIGGHLKAMLTPLLEDLPTRERVRRLGGTFPRKSREDRLREIIANEDGLATWWMKATAAYTVKQLELRSLADVLVSALSSEEPIVRETALWALCLVDQVNRDHYLDRLREDPSQLVQSALARWCASGTIEVVMLSTIEKVIILKSVPLFAQVPDDVLADAARLLTEARVIQGETIIHKGEVGDSMYIIVTGRLRIHDGGRILNYRGSREVIGEMALLDAEPRSASVTAEEDSLLLRLDQALLHKLMDDYGEVARGIIRVLSGKLRQQVRGVVEDRTDSP